MKTENKNMRIMEPGNTTEGREAKGTKYKPVQPVVLDTISNSTLRNLRAERAIPFYKLGGTFLYSKEEIMNYLASNYSRRI